ncbi:MAG: dTMP kinase [Gemmatimonadaceae bacterium]
MTVSPRAGALVVFEGAEGVGKSTQVRRFCARLEREGQPVLAVREPGGTALGDEIRRLLLDEDHPMDPRAEALLFMASRAQLVSSVIRPALHAGRVVVADRFFLSTYAYQVFGRGLDLADVAAANAVATAGLVPDLTLLLALPLEEGLRRMRARSGPDRIENADAGFHARVAEAFSSFATTDWQTAHREAGPIVTVDASGPEDEVEERIWSACGTHLGETLRLHKTSNA